MEIPIHIHIHLHDHRDGVSNNDVLVEVKKLGSVMAKQYADLASALAGINDITNDLSASVDKVVLNEAAQIALIQALRDQIASGSPVTVEQLEQAVTTAESRKAALAAIAENLRAIASDPAVPVPPPVEIPPVVDPEPVDPSDPNT